MLEIKNLRKNFESGTKALKGLNLKSPMYALETLGSFIFWKSASLTRSDGLMKYWYLGSFARSVKTSVLCKGELDGLKR